MHFDTHAASALVCDWLLWNAFVFNQFIRCTHCTALIGNIRISNASNEVSLSNQLKITDARDAWSLDYWVIWKKPLKYRYNLYTGYSPAERDVNIVLMEDFWFLASKMILVEKQMFGPTNKKYLNNCSNIVVSLITTIFVIYDWKSWKNTGVTKFHPILMDCFYFQNRIYDCRTVFASSNSLNQAVNSFRLAQPFKVLNIWQNMR